MAVCDLGRQLPHIYAALVCDVRVHLAYVGHAMRYLHHLIDYLIDLATYLLGQESKTFLVAWIRVAQTTTTFPCHCNWPDATEVIDDIRHLRVDLVEKLAVHLTRSLVDSLCDTAV